MTKFTHKITTSPSRNWIRKAPEDNYGISTLGFYFVVIGPLGAISWHFSTAWGCASVREHLKQYPVYDRERYEKPRGYDLSYHSYKPLYDDHSCTKECGWLDGADCYSDGSSLNADLLIEGFLCRGLDWVWPKLEEVYSHYFEDAPWPDFSVTELPYPERKSVS